MQSAEADPLHLQDPGNQNTAGMSEGNADCDLEPCSFEECERAVSAPELLELEPLAHSLLSAKPGQPAASPAESSPPGPALSGSAAIPQPPTWTGIQAAAPQQLLGPFASPVGHQSPSHRSSAFLSQGLASPQQCSTPKRLSGAGDDGPLGSPLMGVRTQVSLCMSRLQT